MYFLMQVCLFLCLPKDIYFHFDLFQWNLTFSDANMPIYMPARGVSQHQNSLNFKNVSNRSEGGVSIFQKCLKFKNVPNVGGGGGVNPNWDIVPNFTVFFSDASPYNLFRFFISQIFKYPLLTTRSKYTETCYLGRYGVFQTCSV